MTDIQLFALVVLSLLAIPGAAVLIALITQRPRFYAQVRYVGFFASASDSCRRCGGCGWYPDMHERCMTPCSCVEDPSETVSGNT